MQSETSDDIARFQRLSKQLEERLQKAPGEPVRGHLRRGDLPPPLPETAVLRPVVEPQDAVPVNKPQNQIEQAIWDACYRMASLLVEQHRATSRKAFEEVYGK
jgi:hypothetical protein